MKTSQFPDLFSFVRAFEELEKFKFVERTMPLWNGRHENDAEHSWNLAMWALLLAPEFWLDVQKCLTYALIHDLGELYAGDTYFYDEEKMATKDQREQESMDEFLSHLPENARITLQKSFEAYQKKEDDESQFIYELDKIQPIVLIASLRTLAWKTYNISKEKLLDKKLSKLSEKFGMKDFLIEYLKWAEKDDIFAENHRDPI